MIPRYWHFPKEFRKVWVGIRRCSVSDKRACNRIDGMTFSGNESQKRSDNRGLRVDVSLSLTWCQEKHILNHKCLYDGLLDSPKLIEEKKSESEEKA